MTDAINKAMQDAQINSDMRALMASTDGVIPADIKALIGQRGEGWEITAITAGEQIRHEPDGPLPNGVEKWQWQMSRVGGKELQPPSKLVVRQGYYVRVIGNAVSLESYLQSKGYHNAFAGSPDAVWLGDLCPGRMALRPGNYHECNACGHIDCDE